MSGSVLLSKFAVGQITVNIMVKESSELQSGGEVIIFNTEDGDVQVQVDTVKETVWMTQKGMAELFGVSVPAINQHVKNVYQEGELLEAATVKKNLIVQSEGSITLTLFLTGREEYLLNLPRKKSDKYSQSIRRNRDISKK
jgi:hypothetical protein